MVTTEEQYTEGEENPVIGPPADHTYASDTDTLIRLRDALINIDA